ncbi:MAG: hypothetical protein AAF799_20130 [Myxococcota bacterium]
MAAPPLRHAFKGGDFANWGPGSLNPPLQATWNIGNSDDWPLIENPQISIDGEVNNLFLPASEDDYIECVDNSGSDGQAFLGLDPSPGFTLVLATGDGALSGAQTENGTATANPTFASESLGCSGDTCSRIGFTDAGPDWKLNRLELRSAGSTVVSDGADEVEIERFSVLLASTVVGGEVGKDQFKVAAGAATFLASYELGGVPVMLPVSNATPIVITKHGSIWTTSTFSLQFVDSENAIWSLAVGGAKWM